MLHILPDIDDPQWDELAGNFDVLLDENEFQFLEDYYQNLYTELSFDNVDLLSFENQLRYEIAKFTQLDFTLDGANITNEAERKKFLKAAAKAWIKTERNFEGTFELGTHPRIRIGGCS